MSLSSTSASLRMTLGPPGASWGLLGTYWGFLGPPGASLGPLGPPGTS